MIRIPFEELIRPIPIAKHLLKTPAEKVFGPLKYAEKTFSGGIWMSREYRLVNIWGI